MPTEITLEPAKSSNATALSGMKEGQPAGATTYNISVSNDLYFGSYGVGKNSIINTFVVAQYDLSSVPLGSQLTKVKVEMKAKANGSLFNGNLEVAFIRDDRFNAMTLSKIDGRWKYRALGGYSGAYTDIWSSGSTSSGGVGVNYDHSLAHGIGSFAQAWSPATTQSITTHSWRIGRLATGGSANTKVYVNLYEAEGSSGNYTKGALIDRSAELAWTDISSASYLTGNAVFIPLSTTLSVDAAKTYISELAIDNADETSVSALRAFYVYGEDTGDHAALYSASGRYMQGFLVRGIGFLSDQEIRDAALSGDGSTFAPPAFTAGQVYTFGSSGYSGGANFTTADQMLIDFQAALDARTSTDQRVAVRMKPAATQSVNQNRRVEGIQSGSTAVRDGLKGLLLTCEFTPPASAVLSSVSVSPSVDAGVGVDQIIDAGVSTSAAVEGDVAVSDRAQLPKILKDVERG